MGENAQIVAIVCGSVIAICCTAVLTGHPVETTFSVGGLIAIAVSIGK